MFTSIVVGTDGSERAARAVEQASALAKICGATLHVVGAYKGIDTAIATAMAAGSLVATPPALGHASEEEAEAAQRALESGVDRSGPTASPSKPTRSPAARRKCSSIWPSASGPISSSSATEG